MSEPTPRAADLEAGLADIDRRLRQIQDELVGTDPPAPPEPERSESAAAQAHPQVEEAGHKRQGRSGPLAAVLQRATRSAAHGSRDPRGQADRSASQQDDARRVADARAQLDDLERQLQALRDLRDKLVASIRDLVDGYEAAAQAQPGTTRRPAAGAASGATAASGAGPEVTLSAGPFASLEMLRAFERALASLPNVRETSLRGYEGEDRAIVIVRLAEG